LYSPEDAEKPTNLFFETWKVLKIRDFFTMHVLYKSKNIKAYFDLKIGF
jgi:hypothetical protein